MEKLLRWSMMAVAFIAVAVLVQTITTTKMQTLRLKTMATSPDVATIKTRERQLECLAINIYKEAGYEPFEGKVAVAQVVMNRVNSSKFPEDICGVVYQKNIIMEKVVCQFSWYCDSTHKNRAVNQVAYQESYEVAKKVLLEGFKLDVLKEALYYHAVYVNPRWPHEKIGKIGQHIFYKEKPKKEQYASAI